ncbi:MAG: response regulator [Lamprobacter sp.]|uniref:response regulator n=1 Tax=Lamprobacter sp. TaxID=3100796 RepID=UPI002B260962|nr:response regulator [Lamprobacter sp.]MEA3642059.1 response regulator [Lamprobacter sp.]
MTEQTEQRPAPSRSHKRFSGRRVLIVDDNDFNRALMRAQCEMRGMTVVDSQNGSEALRLAKTLTLDLVFMDIHMPAMDGIEVAWRLCALLPVEQQPRIIALSADAFVGERSLGLETLFDAFLLKPITDAALDKTLDQCLHLPSPMQAAGAREQAFSRGGAA